jgi:hypothetical protein
MGCLQVRHYKDMWQGQGWFCRRVLLYFNGIVVKVVMFALATCDLVTVEQASEMVRLSRGLG